MATRSPNSDDPANAQGPRPLREVRQVIGSARKLAAILSADIKDYSRLMGMDEEGTLARVKRIWREVIEPTLSDHHGRLVKTTGDGILAMFDSPVEAVRCAIVIQQSMVGRNTLLPSQQWIQFRIGVNLGDVIVDPDDVYGEGVNIAARLQTMAEVGGVYISGGVYEQIKNKLVCGYQSLGDEKLKNITDPVRVYRVLPDRTAVERRKRFGRRHAGIAAALIVASGAAGWFAWPSIRSFLLAQLQQTATSAPAVQVTRQEPVASSAPPAIVPEAARPNPAPAAAPQQEAAPVKQAQRPPMSAPYELVRDCAHCPELVKLPGGTFNMGSTDDPSERPVHAVTIRPFAIGRFAVTVGEWMQCVAAKACSYQPGGDEDAPADNLSWDDAQQYIAWLSATAQAPYRLPTESEWEYAARGNTTTRFWWGERFEPGKADCQGCGEPYDAEHPLKVGSFPANPFGLHDMAGGVSQWVSDCWHKDYVGAPRSGISWDMPICHERVLRGGSWMNASSYTRSASRDNYDPTVRYLTHGLRVARSL